MSKCAISNVKRSFDFFEHQTLSNVWLKNSLPHNNWGLVRNKLNVQIFILEEFMLRQNGVVMYKPYQQIFFRLQFIKLYFSFLLPCNSVLMGIFRRVLFDLNLIWWSIINKIILFVRHLANACLQLFCFDGRFGI